MMQTMTTPRFSYDIQLPDQRLRLELSGSILIYTGSKSGQTVREVENGFTANELKVLATKIAVKNGGSIITK